MAAARLLHATPVLCVGHAQPTIDYLVSKLGFRLDNSVGNPVAWASLIRDRIELMLLAERGLPKPAEAWAAYVYIDDADGLHAEALARGADIVRPPEDMPYNNREFEVRLPDGQRLAFGGPIPGAA
jgi:hypothetical protein